MAKLMYVGDYGKTGFGTVANGVLRGLHNRGWDILHMAINYNDLEPVELPWKMVPAGFYHPMENGRYEAYDPYGFNKVNTWVKTFDPDIVLINNDFPVVSRYLGTDEEPTPFAKHRSHKVIYSPMDSWPFPPMWALMARRFDQVISYSYWQKDMMCAVDTEMVDMPVIYHGVDTRTYFPIDKREAKARLRDVFVRYNKNAKNIPNFEDAYIVYFVGTNQWRKDIPALFRAFNEFRRQHPEKKIFLIPHTSAMPMSPTHGGWSLYALRDLTGLESAVLMQYANIFTEDEMNVFYNAADVLAFPTRGEGFGLPSIEAMAAKTPVIATRFGPQYEIHMEKRGYFIEVDDYEPGNMTALTYFAKPSWKSLFQQLMWVYDNPEDASAIAENAYKWVVNHTWDSKAQQFHDVLTDVLGRPKKKLPEPPEPNRAARRRKKK